MLQPPRLEDPFFNTAGFVQMFKYFFRFCWVFLQTFDVFQLPGTNWEFLSDAGMFEFGRGLLVHFHLVDWKTYFSILQGFALKF